MIIERRTVVAGVIGLAALAAVGGWRILEAQQPSNKNPPNPEAGLSEAQRAQQQAAWRTAGEVQQRAFIEEFIRQGRDARRLPRAPLMLSFFPPPPDLAAAVRSASAIVVGTVRTLEWQVPTGARATVDVENVAKGNPGSSVVVEFAGGPTLIPDGEPVLAESEAAPILFPGERAMLFLEPSSQSGVYRVQPFTGWNKIVQGRVQTTEGNPFRQTVTGQNEAALTGTVRGLA